MKNAAIIVAGGSSERFGSDLPKQFHELNGKPILRHTIDRFEEASSISNLIVVLPDDYLLYAQENLIPAGEMSKVTKMISGGKTRQQSVLRGLQALPSSTELVAIHDGARPLVLPSDIDRVMDAARIEGAAMLARLVTDTLKKSSGGYLVSTLDRADTYMAETPQAFRFKVILTAHLEEAKNQDCTDDAMLIERKGMKIKIVEPVAPNPKITTQSDLKTAEALMGVSQYE